MEMHKTEIHIRSKFDVLVNSKNQSVERFVSTLSDYDFSGLRSNCDPHILSSEKSNLNFIDSCAVGRHVMYESCFKHTDDLKQKSECISGRCDQHRSRVNKKFNPKAFQPSLYHFSSEACPGREAGNELFYYRVDSVTYPPSSLEILSKMEMPS